MRGIVFDGEKAVVTDALEVRDPGPTEVKVRIGAAGVCHSDVSVMDGTIPFPTPVVMGHEGAGVVVEVGGQVTTVKPGDHVVIATLANCGMCAECNLGWPTRCKKSMGNMSQPFTFEGKPAWNFAAASVFSEYTVVAETQAVVIDESMPLTSACLIGCGVVTGACCVWNRAGVQRGQTAVVFGVGGVGLNVIQALRIAGARRIVAVDTLLGKEPLARKFGATDFLDARDPALVATVRAMEPMSADTVSGFMNAGGVDWAFDCVGNAGIVQNALEMLDWGGNVVILGVPPATAELSVLFSRLTHVDRGVMGCRYGSVRPHHDIPLIVERYKVGAFLLDELVSETYPLEQFDVVVGDLHEGKLARGVLTF
ncbi:MAG: alcohol dehydrogenase catalytic domain-containing protein [Acidimicrobiales bacterium]